MNIEDLKHACQAEKRKTNKGPVLWNRAVSIYVTRFFIGFNVQADMVTIAGILAGVMGSLLFVFRDWRCNFAGVFLLYVSFLFDQVDGELARYYKKVSLSGVYLDEIRHLVMYSVAVFCLSFPAAEDLHSRLPYLMGFMGALALIIARVEERLPKFVFTEKVLLKENYEGGDASVPSREADKEGSACGKKGYALKSLSACVYRTADILNHQVGFMVWLVGVTIIDHYILRGGGIFGLFCTQTIVFVLFTSVCSLATLGAVMGNYRCHRVDVECRRIQEKLRAQGIFRA